MAELGASTPRVGEATAHLLPKVDSAASTLVGSAATCTNTRSADHEPHEPLVCEISSLRGMEF